VASEQYFFDDLLGELFGVSFQVSPSRQSGYKICVFAGKRPDPERSSVLHLDLEHRTGLFNAHLHWFFQVNDSERFGHAWDDNEPDAPATPAPFEPWVRDRIEEIRAGIARRALDLAMKRVTGARKKDLEDWRELRSTLQRVHDFELERELDGKPLLGQGWECGCGLALCHWQLGQKKKARQLFEEAGRELDSEAPGDDRFRHILALTLSELDELWAFALVGPLDEIARRPARMEHSELTDYLVSLSCPVLVELWTTLLLEHAESADLLATLAARLVAPDVAGHAVRLLEKAIDLDGETPTLLALMQGALYAAGDLDAAEALGERLESEPSVDDIQGKIDEYTRLNNTVSAHQARTGVVPLDSRDKVQRALQLESELNAFWSRRPERYRAQDCRDRRFVSGGSTLWVSMLRDAGDYTPAVEHLQQVCNDWPLLLLRFKANPATVEALINNGLGSCLDSPVPGHLEIGVAIMERCLAELPAPRLALLHWAYACLYARQGRIEEGVAHAQKAVDGGQSRAALLDDTDLESLRSDPRFKKLTGG